MFGTHRTHWQAERTSRGISSQVQRECKRLREFSNSSDYSRQQIEPAAATQHLHQQNVHHLLSTSKMSTSSCRLDRTSLGQCTSLPGSLWRLMPGHGDARSSSSATSYSPLQQQWMPQQHSMLRLLLWSSTNVMEIDIKDMKNRLSREGARRRGSSGPYD